MDKLLTFLPTNSVGEQVIKPLFSDEREDLHKLAAELVPELQEYITRLSPDSSKLYLLVNALGASEMWGNNSNGDRFEEKDLVTSYKTFLTAHPFEHHVNKDPNKALGKVEIAAWNPAMKRVELVLSINKSKAPHLVQRIEKGEYPAVSMGARVKFDQCFPAGTMIKTPQKEVAIEDIVVDDEAIDHLGTPNKVTKLFTTKDTEQTLVKIKAHGHYKELIATENHPIFIVQKEHIKRDWSREGKRTNDGFEPDFVPASELRTRDWVTYPIDRLTTDDESVTYAHCRLLGYYLAEGHTFGGRRGRKRDGAYRTQGVSWSFNINEVEYINEIEGLCTELGLKARTYEHEEKNECVIRVYSRELALFLVKHGGRLSAGKRLSSTIKHLPQDKQLNIFGTYCNGDGSKDLTKSRGQARCVSVSSRLIDDFQDLLLRWNIISSVSVRKDVVTTYGITSELYQLFLDAPQAKKLSAYSSKIGEIDCNDVDGNCFIWNDYLMRPICKLSEEVVETTVYNLSVENNESYVANKMGVHNCSICHNEAKTRRQYCDHLKYHMNEILPDGRQVGAINPNPKFFDISFVLIGADKTAYVLKKVASAGTKGCVDVDTLPNFPLSTHAAEEFSGAKYALARKLAKIYKDIPVDEVKLIRQAGNTLDEKVLPILEANEKRFSKQALAKLAEFELEDAFSTLTLSGISLYPEEFQRLMLTKTGNAKLADQLEEQSIVFDVPEQPVADAAPGYIKTAHFNAEIFSQLEDMLPARSAYSPFLEERVEKLVKRASYNMPIVIPEDNGVTVVHPPKTDIPKTFGKALAALGAGFLWYKSQIPKADWGNLDRMILKDPKVTAALLASAAGILAFGRKATDTTQTEEILMNRQLTKSAATKGGYLGAIMAPMGAAYLGSAYLSGKRSRGQRLNRYESFVADYPELLGGGLAAWRVKGLRKALSKTSSPEAQGVEKLSYDWKDYLYLVGPGWLKPNFPVAAGFGVDVLASKAISKMYKGLSKKTTQKGADELLSKALKS